MPAAAMLSTPAGGCASVAACGGRACVVAMVAAAGAAAVLPAGASWGPGGEGASETAAGSPIGAAVLDAVGAGAGPGCWAVEVAADTVAVALERVAGGPLTDCPASGLWSPEAAVPWPGGGPAGDALAVAVWLSRGAPRPVCWPPVLGADGRGGTVEASGLFDGATAEVTGAETRVSCPTPGAVEAGRVGAAAMQFDGGAGRPGASETPTGVPGTGSGAGPTTDGDVSSLAADDGDASAAPAASSGVEAAGGGAVVPVLLAAGTLDGAGRAGTPKAGGIEDGGAGVTEDASVAWVAPVASRADDAPVESVGVGAAPSCWPGVAATVGVETLAWTAVSPPAGETSAAAARRP